jgi:acetate kinase
MNWPILTFNSGSSSLKFGLYETGPATADRLMSGEIETVGDGQRRLHAVDKRGHRLAEEAVSPETRRDPIERVARLLREARLPSPAIIGHRIVHGGPLLRHHCLIDDAVLQDLEEATPFAPLHLPPALAVIRHAQTQFPTLPQVACFDTSFHTSIPEIARTLPLPLDLRRTGLQRYGFHGLSCESIIEQLGPHLPDRLIIAHLGNGASVTAVRAGRSTDTSMGLTPAGGIPMGTRSGDLDPGILIYLQRERGFTPAALEELVDRRSGLLGLSGCHSDMRSLKEAARPGNAARLAIDIFCYCLGKTIAAMGQALAGVDMIVFTGGIGEHDASLRAAVGDSLAWMGVTLDASRNARGASRISTPASRVALHVLPSREERQIALHSHALAGGP